MNIASFLVPKVNVAFLHQNMSLRQGLEKLRRSGYTAIPVLDEDDRYVGVVSEGDFLWKILEHNESMDEITMKKLENMTLKDIIRYDKIKAVSIETDMEQLLGQAPIQNFVPVVDGSKVFIGIITRSDIIKYFVKKQLEGVKL